jgi:hypothetical protein
MRSVDIGKATGFHWTYRQTDTLGQRQVAFFARTYTLTIEDFQIHIAYVAEISYTTPTLLAGEDVYPLARFESPEAFGAEFQVQLHKMLAEYMG